MLQPSSPSHRPIILVVEDDHLIREMLGILLRAHGYTSECAQDGLEALEAIERYLPPAAPLSLILLDVRLPLVDGEDLLVYLQRRGLNVPVVAISGHAEALEAATALGAHAAVEKPFDLDYLLSVVDRTLKQRVR